MLKICVFSTGPLYNNSNAAALLLACRNETAGEKTVAKIREAGVLAGNARVMKLDNSSLESVRHFVEELKKNYYKVDVLINNGKIA